MVTTSLLDIPSTDRAAHFDEQFGQRSLLTIDTEIEYDRAAPLSRDSHHLDHLGRLGDFQAFCEAIGALPVYMMDWPAAQSPLARECLSDAVRGGRAEIGLKLNGWVTPPLEAATATEGSAFPDGMTDEHLRAKLGQLYEAVEKNFSVVPRIFRAGCDVAGRHTVGQLAEWGIALDSSVHALHDHRATGGPDFSLHQAWPYWIGDEPRLLEVPPTSVFWGMLRRQGEMLFPFAQPDSAGGRMLARFGLLERIELSPEASTKEAALRGIDIALDDGLPVLTLRLHGASLMPGAGPYVHDETDLDRLFDWLRGVYAYFEIRQVRPTSVAEIMRRVVL